MPTKVEEARGAVIACCECDWHGTPKCDASEAVARLESAIREEERAKWCCRPDGMCLVHAEQGSQDLAAEKVRVLEELRQRWIVHETPLCLDLIDKMLSESRADEPVAGSATEKHRAGEYDGRTWTESDLKEPEPGGGRCRICGINDPRIVHVDDASHPVVCYVKERVE